MVIITLTPLINMPKKPQWKKWECWIMNIIDFRYWLCKKDECEMKCHYEAPYGLVIMADCKKHD